MAKMIDITGQKFGRLTAIKPIFDGRRYDWLCECECGNTCTKSGVSLRNGQAKSCGCLHSEQLSNRNKIHGHSSERLYRVWKGMKTRCYIPSHKSYKDYGGRGIKVCDEWCKDYSVFREWSIENGYDETAKFGECTIDRIDVNGDYCPTNCRWVDLKTQANNKRIDGHKKRASATI